MATGVTPEGFSRPTVLDLKDLIETEQRALISSDLDQSSEGVLGQINAIFARQLGLAWEGLEASYNGFDPDRADDFILTALAKLTGTRRASATQSTVAVNVVLDDGTTLEAGTHYAHVTGKTGIRFTPQEDITAVGDGTYSATFVAEGVGPVAAATGTLSAIATPVVGWSSVTNTEDAVLGQDADTDPTLRAKREDQLAAAGSSTLLALRSDILQLGSWIQSVTVFENVTGVVDANGLPPHSFEVLIHDEGSPIDADDLVAQAIWNTKPSGIRAFGDGGDSGTATTVLDTEVVVPFSRIDEVPIYMELTVTTEAGFSDVAGIKSYIAESCNARYSTAGTNVIALYAKGLALDIQGVIDVTTFFVERDDDTPDISTNVTIGVRELARFDTANITVDLS